MDIKTKLLRALEGTTSQTPMDTAKLYLHGTRQQVESVLLALYHAQEINCCKVEKGGKVTILWWKVGACLAHVEYGRPGPKAKA